MVKTPGASSITATMTKDCDRAGTDATAAGEIVLGRHRLLLK
jgi:hypothetical protein